MTHVCPMCDGPLRASDLADDVLVCPACGPVVYLGRTRAPDMVVQSAWGEEPLAAADAQAFPHLAAVLGAIIDEQPAEDDAA